MTNGYIAEPKTPEQKHRSNIRKQIHQAQLDIAYYAEMIELCQSTIKHNKQLLLKPKCRRFDKLN